MIGKNVIVRTLSAGVHYGTLMSQSGKEVVLSNSRRIWEWYGAFTLSEIAMNGLDTNRSRVAICVPEIMLTEAIEIIPTTEVADASLKAAHA